MKRHAAPYGVLLLVATACLLVAAPRGAAQDTQGGFRRYNPNPVVISGQVRLALERQQHALRLLSAGPTSVQEVRDIHAALYDAYVLLRFASGGVRTAKGMTRFPNPLLQMQEDHIDQARADLRQCITEVGRADGPHVEPALERLNAAIAQVKKVSLLLF